MRENKRGLLIIVVVLTTLSISLISVSALDYVKLHRFWDSATNQHFYTTSKDEKAKVMLTIPTMVYEGPYGYVYITQIPGTIPLYRLVNLTDNRHYYTTNNTERTELLVDPDIKDEEIQGYIYSSPGTDRVPLYRYFHPGYPPTYPPDNFYTTSESEKNNKIDFFDYPPWNDYQYIGIEGYLKEYTLTGDSQIILQMYKSNNSHAAIWSYKEYYITIPPECLGPTTTCNGLSQTECNANKPTCTWQGEYPVYRQPGYPIYYDEIFGYPYELPDPHVCTGTNKVLELYQENNSHAQIPNGPSPYYQVDVCYGDLECEADNSLSTECTDPNKQVVVRLFENTNSHVSNASTLEYPIKICCKTNYFPATPDAYFANMKGETIQEADVGDTVLLIYTNRAGSIFNFEIKEEDPLFDDDINTLSGFDLNADYVAKWTITPEDYQKGEDETEQIFYFKINSITSNKIKVLRNSNRNNSFPHAIITQPLITTPQENRRYKVNQDVDFSEECYDEDDSLKITWEFGDETTYQCIWPDEDCDVTHQYLQNGTQKVYLKVEEINRARKATDYTEIYTYSNGVNLFPIITTPPTGSIYPYSDLPIRFNASQSYVSKCQTGSCPIGFTCYTDPIVDLYCYDYPKTGAEGIGTNPGQYNLWFNWTFSNKDTTYGDWVNNYIDAVDYTKYFFQPQRYKAKLKIGLEQF